MNIIKAWSFICSFFSLLCRPNDLLYLCSTFELQMKWSSTSPTLFALLKSKVICKWKFPSHIIWCLQELVSASGIISERCSERFNNTFFFDIAPFNFTRTHISNSIVRLKRLPAFRAVIFTIKLKQIKNSLVVFVRIYQLTFPFGLPSPLYEEYILTTAKDKVWQRLLWPFFLEKPQHPMFSYFILINYVIVFLFPSSSLRTFSVHFLTILDLSFLFKTRLIGCKWLEWFHQ